MYKVRQTLAAMAGVVFSACFLPAEAVVKGTPTADTETWGLVWLDYQTDTHCTGILVASDWVLTAAHCTAQPLWRVCAFGRNLANPYGLGCSSIDRVVKHPSFVGGQLAETAGLDVALLHLTDPIDLGKVDTRRRLYSNTLEHLVGAGITCYGDGTNIKRWEESGADPGELSMRQADLTVWSVFKWGFKALSNALGQITTSGDSGGPCLSHDSAGLVLVGLSSRRELSGSSVATDFTITGIYSAAPLFRDWVRDNLYPERAALPRVPVPGVEFVGIADGTLSLSHTLRRSTDGQFYRPQPLASLVGAMGGILSAGLAQDDTGALHLLALGASGMQLLHAKRTGATWTQLSDVLVQAGRVPPLRQVSVAGSQDLHLIALSRDGRLFYTVRRPDGQWAHFEDILAKMGSPGPIGRVSTTLDPLTNQLHLFVLCLPNSILHATRDTGGTWSGFETVDLADSPPAILDLSAAVSVTVPPIAPGVPYAELNLVWTTGDSIWHSVRTRQVSRRGQEFAIRWLPPENITPEVFPSKMVEDWIPARSSESVVWR